MDKTYQPNLVEEKISSFWEKGQWSVAKIDPQKKPYCIILPLPNANDPIHVGHALFIVQDILCRWHRMMGDSVLWLPGADHAGIETQFVFEKKLAKEGKSRFDFDRETLYKMIWDFVEKNREINKYQLNRLGFSLDWSRYHYSLEPEIVAKVIETFKKMHADNLVYRGERIVNYCPKCGTAFSDLEVEYEEREDKLYYLDYGPIQIATTRPETIFADVAVAVNPKDKHYTKLIGQQAIVPLINKSVPIIADDLVSLDFGTGALKITPGHDQTDFAIGQKNNLELISVIDKRGRLINVPNKYLGLKVAEVRTLVVEDLQKAGKLLKTEPLKHTVGICYRCKTTIEPLAMPQWFVRVKTLAERAILAVKKGDVKIVPKKRFEKMYFDWLNNIHDWNISRQIVWSPRLPIWYCLDCNPDIVINFIAKSGGKISGLWSEIKEKYSLEEIKSGLQALSASKSPIYSLEDKACEKCGSRNVLQETDTFDTWFLSGQWPINTLKSSKSKIQNSPAKRDPASLEKISDFDYFYPTTVLDTLWDILFFWVCRMMMFGLYLTDKVPFKTIHIHCRVVDAKGQKMSKSKGNVLDPLVLVEKYGADALRMALVFGAAPGSDICLSEDKVRAMRNFANKIWNAARFVLSEDQIGNLNSIERVALPMCAQHSSGVKQARQCLNDNDRWILSETQKTTKKITGLLEKYRFDLASEEIYHFFWHKFCDKYLESIKNRREEAQPVLLEVLETSLKLLHPFMPFLTEEIYQKLPSHEKSLMIAPWPVFKR